MRTLSILFFISIVAELPGQSIDSLIITQEQNEQWLDKLERENLEGKVAMIRKRTLLDTAIYVRQSFSDRIKIEDQYKNEKRVEGSCRPLLVFDGQPVHITNGTGKEQIKDLADILNTTYIKEVRTGVRLRQQFMARTRRVGF